MVHDPLSPSQALRTRTGFALITLGVVVFVYSLLIIGQFLVGLFFFLLPGGLYLTYRIFAVLDSIADAAQRHAAVKEREADRKRENTPREVGADPTERTTTRLTSREE